MKKLLLPISLLALGLFFYVKNTGANMQAELIGVSVNKPLTNLKVLVLNAKVRVTNASESAFKIDSIIGAISYKESRVATISQLKTIEVKAKSFTDVYVPISISTLTVGLQLATAYLNFTKTKIAPSLRVQMRINTALGAVDIDKLQPLA